MGKNRQQSQQWDDDTGAPLIHTGAVLVDRSSTGKERPWNRHKKENEQVAELFTLARGIDPRVISDDGLDRLRNCGQMLIFDVGSNGEKHLAHATFCKNRLCPLCSWRRSLLLYSQVSDATAEIINRYPGVRFAFLTLTVRNVSGQELPAALDALGNAWRYLTQKGQTFALAKELKKFLLGYMKATEITYNSKTDTYHPHIHAILILDPRYFFHGYMNVKKWAETWGAALGVDYSPSVSIRMIRSTARAIAEVGKYPVKVDTVLHIKNKNKQNAAAAVVVLHKAMFHRRFVTFGGIFAKVRRELHQQDIDKADLIQVDTDAVKINVVGRMLYRWHARVGCYIND